MITGWPNKRVIGRYHVANLSVKDIKVRKVWDWPCPVCGKRKAKPLKYGEVSRCRGCKTWLRAMADRPPKMAYGFGPRPGVSYCRLVWTVKPEVHGDGG